MTGARRRVPLRSPKTPIGSVDPHALKIPARRAECVFTKPHCLHSPPSSIRGVAPPGPSKWLPPPPPLTPGICAVGRGATQEVAGLREGRPSVRDGTRGTRIGDVLHLRPGSADVLHSGSGPPWR